MTTKAEADALGLESAMRWLFDVVDARLRQHFGAQATVADVREIAPPDWRKGTSALADLLLGLKLDFDAEFVLALALAPYLKPQLLDSFLVKNPLTDRIFTEFGGVLERSMEGFRPTLQTAAFVLAGENLARRLELVRMTADDHVFAREGLLRFVAPSASSAEFAAAVEIEPECLARLTGAARRPPPRHSNFPARPIETALDWSDLVLSPAVRDELEAIGAWVRHRDSLVAHPHLGRRVRAGYRALFHGPPGSGKTVTAGLLGKSHGLNVYRIDLSLVVSKWVGETEKNLAAVFDRGRAHQWILFFDEADSLFAKRTAVSTANDRYANQEVSYLLQSVEDYPGLVILASNLRSNLDEAFVRRFQSIVYFGAPGQKERASLWRNVLGGAAVDPALEPEVLAERYELTGGEISNVAQHAFLAAKQRGDGVISLADLQQGARRELRKSGRNP